MVASSLVRDRDPSALAENSTVGPYLPETVEPGLERGVLLDRRARLPRHLEAVGGLELALLGGRGLRLAEGELLGLAAARVLARFPLALQHVLDVRDVRAFVADELLLNDEQVGDTGRRDAAIGVGNAGVDRKRVATRGGCR